MSKRLLLMALVVALATCLLAVNIVPAQEKGAPIQKTEEVVKAAKEILAKHKDAIVMVRIVLKVEASWGGRSMGKREQKVEANGTIVDPSGLTIISHSHTDVGGMLGPININMGDDEEEGGGGGYRADSEVTDVKIVLNDGKEYPASIVLQDKDLDLAFVRPDEKGLKLPYVRLEKTAPPEVLEQVVTIMRLDFSTGREPVLTYGPVMAIVKKPRTHYLTMGVGDTGCPAFNTKGQCLGLILQRKGQGGLRGLSIGSIMGFMPAILPAEDIIDVMKQVPPPGAEKKKPPPPKKGEEEEEEEEK